MQTLTEAQIRESFVNADALELERMELPHDFALTDWDFTDFLAWRDPAMGGRGYIVAEVDGQPAGVVLRAASSTSGARHGICNLCRTMQPGNQVTMFTARRAGREGENGNTIGTLICADLSCHENVRLAAPLAPNEYRGAIGMKIDGTARRSRAFVERVLEPAA